MKKLTRVYINFLILLTLLMFLTIFKGTVTGYAVLDSLVGPFTLFQVILIILTITAIGIIMSIAFYPKGSIEQDIKESGINERVEIAQLEDFVKEEKIKGFSDEEIKKALTKHYWDEQMIEHALAKVTL